jgi:hypothetical protein
MRAVASINRVIYVRPGLASPASRQFHKFKDPPTASSAWMAAQRTIRKARISRHNVKGAKLQMPNMFKTPQDRLNAERLLREDAKAGSWTAAGFGLLVEQQQTIIKLTARLVELLESDKSPEVRR